MSTTIGNIGLNSVLSEIIQKAGGSQQYQKKKITIENAVFHMPKDPEIFLAALAAIEAFDDFRSSENYFSKSHGGVEIECTTFLVDVDPALEHLIQKDKFQLVVSSSTEIDLEVYMDKERATNLACTTGKHLVEGFALLIGAKLKTIFPASINSVAAHVASTPSILLLDKQSKWNGWEALGNRLKGNKLTIFHEKDFEGGDLLTKEFIDNFSMVIGERSFGTYLASARKKIVLELYCGVYKNWMAKWENPSYSMIYSADYSVNSISAEFVFNSTLARLKTSGLSLE